ncbi:hypothetical protein [Ferruginibacter profundus]
MFISIIRRHIYLFLLFCTSFAFAQKKIGIDLSFGVRKSFSNDLERTYITNPSFVSLQYYSRKKFDHPYFNLLGTISYAAAANLKLGLQTGIHVHYSEHSPVIYNLKRTTLRPSLQLTQRYTIWAPEKSTIGIEAAEGFIFFSQDDYIYKFRNGALFNLGIFYSKNNEGLLKLGIEKQIDYVTAYLKTISQYSPEDFFKYRVKRLSFAVSYGITIR